MAELYMFHGTMLADRPFKMPTIPARPDVRIDVEGIQTVCGLLLTGGVEQARDYCEEHGWVIVQCVRGKLVDYIVSLGTCELNITIGEK